LGEKQKYPLKSIEQLRCSSTYVLSLGTVFSFEISKPEAQPEAKTL